MFLRNNTYNQRQSAAAEFVIIKYALIYHSEFGNSIDKY